MPMLASVRLEEKSPASCAVSSWRDRLYLAWTGTDYHINLASSADGRAITGKQRLADTSLGTVNVGWVAKIPFPPALTLSGTRLWLAWLNGSDIYMCDAEHRGHPHRVTSKAQARSLSLTATGPGGLTAAYTTGTFRKRVHLLTMAEDTSGGPPRAVDKTQLDVADYAGLAVCNHEGRLILAWTATGGRIYLLTVTADGPGAPMQLEEARSSHAPALCSHDGRLILAWTGTGGRINLASVQ